MFPSSSCLIRSVHSLWSPVNISGNRYANKLPNGIAIPPRAIANPLSLSPNHTDASLAGALYINGYPIAVIDYPSMR